MTQCKEATKKIVEENDKRHYALMSLCYYIRKYTRLGNFWRTKMYFSQFHRLEVQHQGTSRIGIWWGSGLYIQDGTLCTVSSGGDAMCPHMAEGRRAKQRKPTSSSTCVRTLNPFMETLPSCLNHYLKALFLILWHWWLILGGHIQNIAPYIQFLKNYFAVLLFCFSNGLKCIKFD